MLQVALGVHVPFPNQAFGTQPLSLEQRLLCVAMASGVLWFSELRKWVLRLAACSKCGNEQMQMTLDATLRDESVKRSRNVRPAWLVVKQA